MRPRGQTFYPSKPDLKSRAVRLRSITDAPKTPLPGPGQVPRIREPTVSHSEEGSQERGARAWGWREVSRRAKLYTRKPRKEEGGPLRGERRKSRKRRSGKAGRGGRRKAEGTRQGRARARAGRASGRRACGAGPGGARLREGVQRGAGRGAPPGRAARGRAGQGRSAARLRQGAARDPAPRPRFAAACCRAARRCPPRGMCALRSPRARGS